MAQLTLPQRYQIAGMMATSSHTEIANAIGVHRTTVTRELARNKAGRSAYTGDTAQQIRDQRKANATNAKTIANDVLELVCSLIRKDLSPDQVAHRLKLEQGISISHETIYQHIYANKRDGDGTLLKHLRCQKMRRKRYGSGEERRGVIKNQTNISQRAQVVEDRSRIGDFEGDTVIGKKHKGGLVTLVDRHSRFLLAAHIRCKRAELVTSVIVNLLLPFKNKCHTITFDNGKEFAQHDIIADSLDALIYFANPYHSWERGTNENTNGLLRQYFPKGTMLDNLTDAEVQNAVNKINHRPRKILGYKSAYEVFYGTSMRYTD